MKNSSSHLTDTVIKKWAYKNTSDTDIRLETLPVFVEHSDLLLTLVSDPSCPQRAKILNTLYSLVGKAVSQHNTEEIDMIKTLLTKAENIHDDIVGKWISRSKLILKDLRKYDYVEWCAGGFVRRDLG